MGTGEPTETQSSSEKATAVHLLHNWYVVISYYIYTNRYDVKKPGVNGAKKQLEIHF